ncbi:hypothetical protein LN042_23795 [Kitasatospora sp. RB6PN24]|uniref:hypothetical protein n=1 Tax=Kitasatospora humi TaxID=2893891 RepID=UPI001E4F408C|nr:hypothetical protein [Kitasatospora humi]MCC9310054.1 hypothetical protein [Kitasatospora humi]
MGLAMMTTSARNPLSTSHYAAALGRWVECSAERPTYPVRSLAGLWRLPSACSELFLYLPCALVGLDRSVAQFLGAGRCASAGFLGAPGGEPRRLQHGLGLLHLAASPLGLRHRAGQRLLGFGGRLFGSGGFLVQPLPPLLQLGKDVFVLSLGAADGGLRPLPSGVLAPSPAT